MGTEMWVWTSLLSQSLLTITPELSNTVSCSSTHRNWQYLHTDLRKLKGIWEYLCWWKTSYYTLPVLCNYWEKAMAPHSSTVARKIPWMEEPGRLQSMGSLRVRHDWATSLSLSTFMHWRGKWQPTPVFLPGESHGRRSLIGCSPWGRTELDMTEAT